MVCGFLGNWDIQAYRVPTRINWRASEVVSCDMAEVAWFILEADTSRLYDLPA